MPFRLPSRKQLLLASAFAVLPFGAMAESGSGAYLAAAVAAAESDYAAAADWYGRALASDPSNPALLEGAVLAQIAIGQMDQAAQTAKALAATGAKSQTATVALIAEAAKRNDFDAILKQSANGSSAGAVLDDLVKAWAKLGLGHMSEATEAFDKMAKTNGLEAFGLYNKALALASAGDFEGADAILSGRQAGGLSINRRGLIAHVQILSQLEHNTDAIALLDHSFAPGSDVEIDDLRRRLAAGEPIPFDIVRNATDGIAEVFFTMATAVNGQANASYTLMHARAAAWLRPDNTEAQLLTAGLLEQQKQHDLATEVYAQIAATDPAFHIAEIGRANATFAAGHKEAALEILQGLARSHGNILSVQIALGDGMRREGKFEDALKAYDAALAMVTKAGPEHWVLYFSRGICFERLGKFAEGDADMRHALQLNPNEPQVLNYFGYSLVDRGEKLDEALAMIQQAVAAKPDSGAILDSLAWAYFRLGRYAEALAPMEQASLLEPVDAVVTDHLGDVYWSVGRTREAEFQWRRALSFNPEEKDATRIRLKLDQGLDAVLAKEGAPLQKPVDAAAVTP